MQTPKPITVLSWNCLADCYAQGAFASRLRDQSVLQWSRRSKRIFAILRKSNADIVCLQEVDHYEEHYKPVLLSMNYSTVYLQRHGREDGVLISVKSAKFDILEKDIVQFDDLALAGHRSFSGAQRQRFRKQNVALILLVRTKFSRVSESGGRDQSFTICTTHMYWNPILPQVKLAQARYLLERITYVRERSGLPPSGSVLTGDFNSLPSSTTYRCIQTGISFPVLSWKCTTGAAERAFSAMSSGCSSVRFVCDGTLGRLARWLRLLGVDTALEDKASQDRRTRFNDFEALFEKARSEQRVLVTTSIGLLKRASCPETFFVETSKSGKNLEKCLASLLNRYNVHLDKANILSICCKCGGPIESCSTNDTRLSGREAPSDRELFICSRCSQVYWWSSSENGSSARAKRLAEYLFSTVHGSRERIKQGQKSTCSSGIRNGLSKGCSCAPSTVTTSQRNLQDRSATDRVQSALCDLKKLPKSNWLRYRSALVQANGQEPEYTNVNGSFHGTLDYIFVGGTCGVAFATVQECFQLSVSSGAERSFPNHDWPSDHMLLMAGIVLKRQPLGRPGFSRTFSSLI